VAERWQEHEAAQQVGSTRWVYQGRLCSDKKLKSVNCHRLGALIMEVC
jgi:hypothetical protein